MRSLGFTEIIVEVNPDFKGDCSLFRNNSVWQGGTKSGKAILSYRAQYSTWSNCCKRQCYKLARQERMLYSGVPSFHALHLFQWCCTSFELSHLWQEPKTVRLLSKIRVAMYVGAMKNCQGESWRWGWNSQTRIQAMSMWATVCMFLSRERWATPVCYQRQQSDNL